MYDTPISSFILIMAFVTILPTALSPSSDGPAEGKLINWRSETTFENIQFAKKSRKQGARAKRGTAEK